MPPVRTQEKPYHHGDVAAAVLAVGREMLTERRPETMSLREMARKVGVSTTAVYRYYPDKAALLRALAATGLEELADAQRTAAARAGGGREGFLAMGMEYVSFAITNPALFRLIYGHPPEGTPMERGWGGISASMELLLEASRNLSPKGVDPESFALRSWATVHGLAMLVLDGQIPDDRDSLRAALGVRRID